MLLRSLKSPSAAHLRSFPALAQKATLLALKPASHAQTARVAHFSTSPTEDEETNLPKSKSWYKNGVTLSTSNPWSYESFIEEQTKSKKKIKREEGIPRIEQVSDETKKALKAIEEQKKYYAVVEIVGSSYMVTEGDIVKVMRLRDVDVGDVLNMDRVRELGSKDYTIRGSKYVSPAFFDIKATVIEKPVGKDIITLKFRPKTGYKKRLVNQLGFTALRISKLDINSV